MISFYATISRCCFFRGDDVFFLLQSIDSLQIFNRWQGGVILKIPFIILTPPTQLIALSVASCPIHARNKLTFMKNRKPAWI